MMILLEKCPDWLIQICNVTVSGVSLDGGGGGVCECVCVCV